MRPLYLEIEGVKSISDKQTVNFEKVSKSGIFGIFGKTGSGKTTILDSIVLAIYGDTTSSVDNKDFINLERNVAKVNLLFAITDTEGLKKYRVERLYKMDKKRQNPTSNAKLWEVSGESEVCIAEGTSRVNKKLEEDIIGLSKKDFLKCIALPQGAFSEFIKLTRSERLSFVGKLFGLEKYGKPLADKVSIKLKELTKKEIENQGKLSTYIEYTDEYLQIRKTERDLAIEESAKVKAERDIKKAEYERVKNLYELDKKRKEKLEEYNEKLGYKPVIEGLVKEIALFDTVFSIEKEIKVYLKSKEEKLQAEKQIAFHDEKNKDLVKRKKLALKNQELLPDLQEKLVELSSRRLYILELQPKIDLLEEKSQQLKALREEYKKLTEQIKTLERLVELKKKECEKYSDLAKEYDVKDALLKLESQISSDAIKQYATQFLNFLNNLKTLLSQAGFENESAVNQLIAGEIEKIKGVLSQKTQEVESGFLKDCIAVIDKNKECLTKAQEARAEYLTAQATLQSLNENLNKSKEQGLLLKKECDILQEEINAFLGGKTVAKVIKEVENEIDQLGKKINTITEEVIVVEKELNECAMELTALEAVRARVEKELNEAKTVMTFALEDLGIDLQTALKILENRAITDKNRALVNDYNKELEMLNKEIGELNQSLQDCVITEEEYKEICRIYEESEKNVEIITEKLGKITTLYDITLQKNKEWCIINNILQEIANEKKVYSKVFELVKESRFMEFIAEVYLREIAYEAESRVLSLTSGRYGLVYNSGNFFVVDNLSGGKERPVLGLSGGETFLISLSLALALSSQISRKALKKLDFFFLDEGFGTLDDDLVDAVANSLEKLQKANLTVGLITHVNELKNRIASRIEVTGATPLHGTLISDNC